MEENIPAVTPAVIPAKAIQIKSRSINKPLTKRQQEIFDLYESGLKQDEIASKLGINQPCVSLTLSRLASRHIINKDLIKLNAVHILNTNIKAKIAEKSTKDIADLAIEANKIANPVKNDVNVIDKQLNINLDNEVLDKLSIADRLERVRRVLSDGAGN